MLSRSKFAAGESCVVFRHYFFYACTVFRGKYKRFTRSVIPKNYAEVRYEGFYCMIKVSKRLLLQISFVIYNFQLLKQNTSQVMILQSIQIIFGCMCLLKTRNKRLYSLLNIMKKYCYCKIRKYTCFASSAERAYIDMGSNGIGRH